MRGAGGALTAALALVGLSAVLAVPDGADSTEKCDPSPKTAASFCVTYAATLPSPLDAAAPAGVQILLANTSPQHLTQESEWVKAVALAVLSAPSGSGLGVLTPSTRRAPDWSEQRKERRKLWNA